MGERAYRGKGDVKGDPPNRPTLLMVRRKSPFLVQGRSPEQPCADASILNLCTGVARSAYTGVGMEAEPSS